MRNISHARGLPVYLPIILYTNETLSSHKIFHLKNTQCSTPSPFFRILVEVASLQVSRHRGQLDNEAIQLLGHLDLAAQTAGLGESKGKIQHVVLVIVGLGHLVVKALVGDDNVAGRTRAGAAAGTFHLEVVGLGNVEQVIAGLDGKLVILAVLVDKCNIQPSKGLC